MIIDDYAIAEKFLLENQYYRLNIYFHKLMQAKDVFIAGIHFQDVINYYLNDRWLRNELLLVLEPIEIKCRAIISYHMAMKYGSDVFYKNSLYKDQIHYQEVFTNFTNEIVRNKKDAMVIHHVQNYSGLFPIWVIVELLSFNSLSKYLNNLGQIDRKDISNKGFSISEHLLCQWLHVLSVLRNICAHYGYLYQRVFTLRPDISSFVGKFAVNDNLFSMLLVIKRLSKKSDWDLFIYNIQTRSTDLSTSFILADYGFPSNWRSYLI